MRWGTRFCCVSRLFGAWIMFIICCMMLSLGFTTQVHGAAQPADFGYAFGLALLLSILYVSVRPVTLQGLLQKQSGVGDSATLLRINCAAKLAVFVAFMVWYRQVQSGLGTVSPNPPRMLDWYHLRLACNTDELHSAPAIWSNDSLVSSAAQSVEGWKPWLAIFVKVSWCVCAVIVYYRPRRRV